MKSSLFVFLVAFLFVPVGCTIHIQSPPEYEEYPPPDTEYPVETRNSNFDARIEAAKSILSFTEKDQALSSIAIDAADELDSEHTIKALSLMTSFTTKDSTAEKCVTPFINRNMMEEAKNIANKITSFTTKDKVMKRIAYGPEESN